MMRSKKLWVALSILAMLSLLLASCGSETKTTAPTTSAPTTSAPAPVQTSATTKPATTTTAAALEAVPFRKDTVAGALTPKRGGNMITALTADWTAWDPMKAQAIRVGHMQFSSNELMQGDWTKMPQGSGQTAGEWGFVGDIGLETGELAESWSTPDPTTIIYKINKNAKFQNKPPANGRAVTADDVVWNIKAQFADKALWQGMTYPPESGLAPTSVKALDQYTVEVKVPAKSQQIMVLEIGDNLYTNPPECWANGKTMTNWKDVVGSGPWIITDYVSGSAITLSKNPDYFEKDPLHPDQQIPYLDTFKLLVIPDLATRMTAIRTGKIDWLREIAPDDANQIIKANKDLLWSRRLGITWVASGREDKQNLPFKDIKVRRALNLAVDKAAILKDYFKGEGVMLGYPYHPTPGYAKLYTPMEQLPSDVQELFTYNPTKAKELLKEAGYPNGFKTKIQGPSERGDEMSMIQSYLSAVGVDMKIETMEMGVFNSMDAANSQDEMWYGMAKGIWAPHEMLMTKKGVYSNDAIIDDPYYIGVQDAIAANITSNPDVMFKKLKEAGVYELQSAWAIWMPVPFQYNVWWPWTQNYYGVNWEGWANAWDWTKYLWIDQNLKKSMGY